MQVGSDKIVYGLGPLYVVSGSGTTTFARDGGKSVRAELNGSGAVNATFRYKAYGAMAQSNGAPVPTYVGYAGQLLDPSGLYYMRARWYDAASGRFVSRDPLVGKLAEPISLNQFGYASANPAIKRDPSGLDAESLLDVGGGGGGLEGAIPADSSLGGGGGLGVAIALGISGAVVWIADLLTGGGSTANPQPSPSPGPRKSLTAGPSPRVITGDVINEVEESLAANDGLWTEQVRLVEEATSRAWRGGTNVEYIYKNSVTQERIVQHVITDVDGQVVHVTWRAAVTWTYE